jgi:PPM family protein phosphatase
MKLSIGQKTDPGPRKGGNEDSLLALSPDGRPEMALLVVADGMGGAKGGEHASQEAIRVIHQELVSHDLPTVQDAATRLREAITAANTSVHLKGQSNPDMEGMGCTVVVALIIESTFWVASVGDSRAYLIRDGQIKQLTDDHTWVGQQVRDGVLTAEQAARHSLRHVLDRALGAETSIDIDVWPDDVLKPGDTLLLCTDGLYGVIENERIAQVACLRPVENAADELIRAALQAETRDNVSVVVLQAE